MIGIFGGTFNPPHLGHRAAARDAVDALGLDKLLVIPAADPPHKPLPADSPGAAERLLMTELMFRGERGISVTDMELHRDGPSYTVDTVTELRRQDPDSRFYLLMGTDMFLCLEQWHRVEELLSMVTPVVFARAAGEREQIGSHVRHIENEFGGEVVVMDHDAVPVSSTDLRRALAERDGVTLLDGEVYAEIIARRHYGARPSFPWLREQAYAMLNAARIPHVQGCEEEAVRLARRWGADEDLAREAAILHDITKALDHKQQLLLCQKYDIITDTIEENTPKLLHAKTGAAIARERFGVSDQVYQAILWHTTGRGDMTLLDKVLYMADYIEPTRDFPGLRELRELSYRDLDDAVRLGLDMSIQDLVEMGQVPHPRTREAVNWLTKGE